MQKDTSRIRVLMVIPALLPGGAEMLVRNMLLAGFHSDYDIAVCCLGGPLGTFLERDLESRGLRLFYLGMRSRLDGRVVFSLYNLLKEYRPVIVHTHLNALLYALIPTILVRIPVRVHTVHNTASMEGKPPLRFASRAAFRWFRFVPVGISSLIAKTVEEYYGISEVPVINNGIPTTESDISGENRASVRSGLGIPSDWIICVHVGRFVKQKNHRLLVKSFSSVAKERPDAMLLLIGKGELMEETKAQVKELGLEKQVKFLGVRDDVPAVLSACDIFVFSSDWEGLPITLIEAMAAGLPVVTTSVGGIPDLIEHDKNGYLVGRGDSHGLANAILKIAADRSLAKTMGRNARQFAREHFDISVTVNGHERLYRTLLEKVRAGE